MAEVNINGGREVLAADSHRNYDFLTLSLNIQIIYISSQMQLNSYYLVDVVVVLTSKGLPGALEAFGAMA